ncbi:glycoside hydrolase superfamily [Aspergillus karnatakaensis]|uniref:glycoside hydrolase superfamily n=1 Tax=Aspergillus karnatakaensis TaxID=1810916 RepID=UPI003CCCE9BE
MRFTTVAAAAATAGLAVAGAIPRRSEETCSNELFTGEVLHLSLNVIEYPIIVDVELKEDTVITIDNTLLIGVTNAPTRLHTTVYATSTATITKTISAPTVTVPATAPVTAVNGNGNGSGVDITKTEVDTNTEVVSSVNGGSNGNSNGNGSSENVKTEISTKTQSAGSSETTPSTSTTDAPVAGGSAVGTGINTDLYSVRPTTKPAHTVTTTIYGHGTSTVKTYTATASAIPTPTVHAGEWTDWTKFKANGVNLGGWLEQERVFNQYWWDQYAPDAEDEWTFCEMLGDRCGPVLEERYETFVTTADIDELASVGVNTLRIPTTYAAWISVPGSQLYQGNQKAHLRKIALYAIQKYNMRIIVGLHSLPGGVNSLDIGEKVGNNGWFYNATNMAYSLSAIDEMLTFIVETGYPWAFTLSPINEASDNPKEFASPNTLTANGTAYVVEYTNKALAAIAKVDKRIPLMLQDNFLSEEHWSPYFPAGTNLVIDQHVYYFAASGVYSQWANGAICGQASVLSGDGKFPVFVGEWALQTLYNNQFEERQALFETQRYAWMLYAQGGAFWNIKHNSSVVVDGQGMQRDYWSFMDLLEEGVVHPIVRNATYC